MSSDVQNRVVPTDTCRCAPLSPALPSPNPQQTFVFGWRKIRFLCIFVAFSLFPFAMSSPVREHGRGKTHHPEKWVNPCGIPNMTGSLFKSHGYQESNSEIYLNIVTQVKMAIDQAEEFIESFHSESFQYERSQDKYKNIHYDFVETENPALMSKIGTKNNDVEEMTDKDVEDLIAKLFATLQRFAVGLEQIVLDQAIHGGSFHHHFHEAEFQLKYVLCEFQQALIEKGVVYEDIKREIMGQKIRELDDDNMRKFRDWVIFRDYTTTLKYIEKTFLQLKNQAEKDEAESP